MEAGEQGAQLELSQLQRTHISTAFDRKLAPPSCKSSSVPWRTFCTACTEDISHLHQSLKTVFRHPFTSLTNKRTPLFRFVIQKLNAVFLGSSQLRSKLIVVDRK